MNRFVRKKYTTKTRLPFSVICLNCFVMIKRNLIFFSFHGSIPPFLKCLLRPVTVKEKQFAYAVVVMKNGEQKECEDVVANHKTRPATHIN